MCKHGPHSLRRLACGLILAGLCATSGVHAAGPDTDAGKESAEDVQAAAHSFAEGEKSFKAHDYIRAAAAFEAAYSHAPRPAALWNAARARHRAQQPDRAANLYAKYLRLAAPDAPDRATAETALRELAPSLGQLEIHASGFDSVSIDGQALEDRESDGSARWYVIPGSHVVSGTSSGKTVTEQPTVTAGGATSVVLALEAAPAAATQPSTVAPVAPAPVVQALPPPTPSKPPPADRATSGNAQRTLGWVALAVGGVGVGVGVVSGVIALGKKSPLESQCRGGSLDHCPTSAQGDVDSYNRMRDVSSIGFVVGGIGVVGGAVLLLTAPNGPSARHGTRVTPMIGLNGIGMRGAF